MERTFYSPNYRAIWALFESEKISKKLQDMAMGKKMNKDESWQEDYLEIIRDNIEELEETIAKYDSLCQEAEEAYQKAKATWEKTKQRKAIVEVAKQRDLEKLQKEEKKLERMKIFVLTHATATLSALNKKIDSIIVCTEFDLERMNFNHFADRIEDTEVFEQLLKSDIPKDAVSKFESVEEYVSAIHYVRMVVQYWSEDKPFELLYHDEGIKYILDSMNLC